MPPRTIMQAPINLIFHFLQTKSKVEIWLYDNSKMRMQGQILGFDEYMNLVLGDAAEVSVKTGEKKPVGRILLKGDTVSLITAVPK